MERKITYCSNREPKLPSDWSSSQGGRLIQSRPHISTICYGLSCRWIHFINEQNIHLASHITVEAPLLSASSSSRSSSATHQVACNLPFSTTSRLSRLREQRLGAAAGRRSEEVLAATRSAVTLRRCPSRRVCRGR